MKEKKNTVPAEHTRKELIKIVERIGKERKALEEELNNTNEMLKAKLSSTEKAKLEGFSMEVVLDSNYGLTVENLTEKKWALQSALRYPFYADPEFRKHSVIYLESIVNDFVAADAEIEKEFEANDEEAKEVRRKREAIKEKRDALRYEAYQKLLEVGMTKEAGSAGRYGANSGLLAEYKLRLDAYEN